mgnify:CR=1 FL=1|jgi:hypothetical protein
MKDLLIECRTALGLAKSMAERERYDTDVYTKRIEMIDKALRKLAVVGRSEQLPCDCNVKLAETTLQVYCPKCYKTHKMK